MGPAIKIFMREPEAILPNNKWNSLRIGLGQGHGVVGKTKALGKWIFSKDRTLAFAKVGKANPFLAEVDSLVYISGFVTGIERGFKVVDRIGAYTDILTGHLSAEEIKNEGGFESTWANRGALERYSKVSFSDSARTNLGWVLLLTKTSYTLDAARLKNFSNKELKAIENTAKSSNNTQLAEQIHGVRNIKLANKAFARASEAFNKGNSKVAEVNYARSARLNPTAESYYNLGLAQKAIGLPSAR